MRRPPLRRLVFRGGIEPDRIFHHNVWYRGHTNRRYEELLPRLERVDAYLVFLPERRLARAVGFRMLARSLGPRAPLVRAGARAYRSAFVSELDQIAVFEGPMVADVDDPRFDQREVDLLNRPNLLAYTVTAESAALRFAELGVDKPAYVIAQGFPPFDAGKVAAIRRRRRSGEVVVGYISSHLLLDGDRGGTNALYNVEHLLDLWQEIRARVPAARLWLMGAPSKALRERLAGRDDVVLTGLLPPEDALAYIPNFDVALYPRTEDQGVRAGKIAEYLGAGVPTVSYDYEVVADLRETGAGILVSSPREFIAAVERLARDPVERSRYAAAAREAGRTRNWDLLAGQMNEILDRYLSPA
jgi:glycosyltransferase involved in cell wall biosynthesis